jgi:transposase
VRNCNRSLRAAILGIADNLIVCNHHFQALATQWNAQGKDPRATRIKVGLRFCRIAFQMVAGRQVFRHPSIQGRHYILDKLTAFHRLHDTGMPEVLRDLQAAIGQIPPREHALEAKPLQEEYWGRCRSIAARTWHDASVCRPYASRALVPGPETSGGRRYRLIALFE